MTKTEKKLREKLIELKTWQSQYKGPIINPANEFMQLLDNYVEEKFHKMIEEVFKKSGLN